MATSFKVHSPLDPPPRPSFPCLNPLPSSPPPTTKALCQPPPPPTHTHKYNVTDRHLEKRLSAAICLKNL